MKFYLNINGGKPMVYAFANDNYVGADVSKDGYNLTDAVEKNIEYDFICTFEDILASLGISEEGEYKFPLANKSDAKKSKKKVADEE